MIDHALSQKYSTYFDDLVLTGTEGIILMSAWWWKQSRRNLQCQQKYFKQVQTLFSKNYWSKIRGKKTRNLHNLSSYTNINFLWRVAVKDGNSTHSLGKWLLSSATRAATNFLVSLLNAVPVMGSGNSLLLFCCEMGFFLRVKSVLPQ